MAVKLKFKNAFVSASNEKFRITFQKTRNAASKFIRGSEGVGG
jgi:hypothetical protein